MSVNRRYRHSFAKGARDNARLTVLIGEALVDLGQGYEELAPVTTLGPAREPAFEDDRGKRVIASAGGDIEHCVAHGRKPGPEDVESTPCNDHRTVSVDACEFAKSTRKLCSDRRERKRLRQYPRKGIPQSPRIPGAKQPVEQLLDGRAVARTKRDAPLAPCNRKLQIAESVENVSQRGAPIGAWAHDRNGTPNSARRRAIAFVRENVGQRGYRSNADRIHGDCLFRSDPRGRHVAQEHVAVCC